MTTQGPKISIITASYNSARTIEQTIKSVVNQTYKNVEYIIIDGASKDETMDIVSRYKEHTHTILSEEDKGVYDAFNKGSKLSTGDYVLFVNSDDYLHDEHVIADMVEFLEREKYPVGIYGDIYELNEQTGYMRRHGRKFAFEDLKRGLMPPHPGFFLKREILEKLGYFKLSYRISADFDLIFILFKEYGESLYYNDRVVSCFRIGGLSSHISTINQAYEESKAVLLNNNCDVSFMNIKKIEKDDYLKRWIQSLLFEQEGISASLVHEDIKRVAVFGTGELALLMYRDLLNHSIRPVVFLDNDPNRWNIKMNEIEIISPVWLANHTDEIDAIVLAFEGYHDEVVMKQIKELTNDKDVKVISWRELIHNI